MQKSEKAIKVTSLIAGIAAIAGAILLVVYLALSLMGFIHPRKTAIVLYTPDIGKAYDGQLLQGSEPEIRGGELLPGHTLQLICVAQHEKVGSYPNEPVFTIRDESGADVTEHYAITQKFGTMTISARRISIRTMDQTKRYDGTPLVTQPLTKIEGTLAEGHTLQSQEGASLLLPGTTEAVPTYQIVDEAGADVTDQYAVEASLGTLTVNPIRIVIQTGNAKKQYDGKPLTNNDWSLFYDVETVLKGHTLSVQMHSSITEVGAISNEGSASVTDENGKDVSHLYEFEFVCGQLSVVGIPLYISTNSVQKEYDGKPLQAPQWVLLGGDLKSGETLTALTSAQCTTVGTVENAMEFVVTAADGTDVTKNYEFTFSNGTLVILPRVITIRTDSAQKVYDGTPLSCSTYSIVGGSLLEGDWLELVCTSITEVGYCENYAVECTIYRKEADGSQRVMTNCYQIRFDYGTLKVTAP